MIYVNLSVTMYIGTRFDWNSTRKQKEKNEYEKKTITMFETRQDVWSGLINKWKLLRTA